LCELARGYAAHVKSTTFFSPLGESSRLVREVKLLDPLSKSESNRSMERRLVIKIITRMHRNCEMISLNLINLSL
jgi:hypothetical protein